MSSTARPTSGSASQNAPVMTPAIATGLPDHPVSAADALDIEGEEATRRKAPRTESERAQRRRWRLLAALGIAAMTAVAIWWGLAATTGKPVWQTVAHRTVSPQMVEVTYEVTKPAEMTVTCTLRAFEIAHGVVGTKEITLGPDKGGHILEAAQIRTSSPAVAAEITRCREAT